RTSNCTPRSRSRSITYLLTAERDRRNSRAAAAKPPSCTTLVKALMLVSLSIPSPTATRPLSSKHRHRSYEVSDCSRIVAWRSFTRKGQGCPDGVSHDHCETFRRTRRRQPGMAGQPPHLLVRPLFRSAADGLWALARDQ